MYKLFQKQKIKFYTLKMLLISYLLIIFVGNTLLVLKLKINISLLNDQRNARTFESLNFNTMLHIMPFTRRYVQTVNFPILDGFLFYNLNFQKKKIYNIFIYIVTSEFIFRYQIMYNFRLKRYRTWMTDTCRYFFWHRMLTN